MSKDFWESGWPLSMAPGVRRARAFPMAFALGSKGVSPTGLPAGFGPYMWGMLVWVLGMGVGGPRGWAMNPNRDLGPRIAHAVLPIAGKGGSDWGYALVPVIGPLVGAGIGSIICQHIGIL